MALHGHLGGFKTTILILACSILFGFSWASRSYNPPTPLSSLSSKPTDDDGGSTQDVGAYEGYAATTAKDDDDLRAKDEHGHPRGSRSASIPVGGGGGEEIAVYETNTSSTRHIQHVFIVLHGKRRDGGRYWTIMDEAVRSARSQDVAGADRHTLVVAPRFFSALFDDGLYTGRQLAWADLNAWQAGMRASHPPGTRQTAIDALSALVEAYSNRAAYPSVANVTVVGHGGGGQLAQRFAAVAKEPPPHVHVRYIHGDPSTSAYFTPDRPAKGEELASCPSYNVWRYGFDSFDSATGEEGTPREYFSRYISRDVVSLVGLEDVEANGDQSCMARVQGGERRRDRNLAWYKYVNVLAGTDRDLRGFPGHFGPLPDWSELSNRTINMRLIVVQNASHDGERLFESPDGRSALFYDGRLQRGWRPSRDRVYHG
ncbi:hypothetical protein CDD83_7145 [Cordyceps sp. RAO-2017]|nr:hypothetical protein CDD83_7145 [Cordyceps sp. RAO-2017]